MLKMASKVIASIAFPAAIFASFVVVCATVLTISITLGGRAPVLNVGDGAELVVSADRGTANVRTLGNDTGLLWIGSADMQTISTNFGDVSDVVWSVYSSYNYNNTPNLNSLTRITAGYANSDDAVRGVEFYLSGGYIPDAYGYTFVTFVTPVETDTIYSAGSSCVVEYQNTGPIAMAVNFGYVGANLSVILSSNPVGGTGTGNYRCYIFVLVT